MATGIVINIGPNSSGTYTPSSVAKTNVIYTSQANNDSLTMNGQSFFVYGTNTVTFPVYVGAGQSLSVSTTAYGYCLIAAVEES